MNYEFTILDHDKKPLAHIAVNTHIIVPRAQRPIGFPAHHQSLVAPQTLELVRSASALVVARMRKDNDRYRLQIFENFKEMHVGNTPVHTLDCWRTSQMIRLVQLTLLSDLVSVTT